MKRKILVSFIGAGNMSKEHILTLQNNKRFILKGIYSRTQNKALNLASNFKQLQNYNSIKELYHQLREKVSDWEGFSEDYHKSHVRFKNNNKIKVYINVQKKCLKIDLISRTDFSGNVKSVKKKFVLDDPKNLFTLSKSNYQETYIFRLSNTKHLDYIVLMLKQKFDT